MLFTGEQFDAKARLSQGLYYLRARYYDPSIGRFLSRDDIPGTAINPQTQNRYPYVLNNPANLLDPSGLCVFGLPCPDPVEDAIECTLNRVDCLRDPLADFTSWVNDHTIDPVIDAIEYCLSSGDQFFECLERAQLAFEGTVVITMGAIIVGAGCVAVPVLLSPTGPGGWTLGAVVCLEASVGGGAAFYAGALIIQSAVSPWDRDSSAIPRKE